MDSRVPRQEDVFANEYADIPAVLQSNVFVRTRMQRLIITDGVAGKVTEGGNRLGTFREILARLTRGELTPGQAILETERQLPRHASRYSHDNRVFPEGWAERLVRTQFSRFYNEAVLETIIELGQAECYVPHSAAEKPDSPCSIELAGRTHDARNLLERLVGAYRDGKWSRVLKIPDHPHCTHVVRPI